jgi:hypothetical protein
MPGWLKSTLLALLAPLSVLPWTRALLGHAGVEPFGATSSRGPGAFAGTGAPHTTPAIVRATAPLDSADAQASGPPPASIVSALAGDAFGPDCARIEHPYWPFEANRCTYAIGDRSFDVVVATPSAERVARWIADASTMIPAVDRLRTRAPDAWEASLRVAARYVMNQSGRTFPIDGIVFEDYEGPTAYEFKAGVTYGTEGGRERTCGDCACRVASLRRTEWCTYVADGLGPDGSNGETYRSCIASLGGERGWNDAWASRCLQIHADAWERDRNDGFRAIFHWVNVHQFGGLSPEDAPPEAIVRAMAKAFTFPHRSAP